MKANIVSYFQIAMLKIASETLTGLASPPNYHIQPSQLASVDADTSSRLSEAANSRAQSHPSTSATVENPSTRMDRGMHHPTSLTNCQCGQLKVREPYRSYRRCPTDNCKRFWCLRENCAREYKNMESMKDHWLSRHISDLLADYNRCGHCQQGLKLRTSQLFFTDCPNCHQFWCLIGSCADEFATKNAVHAHQHIHRTPK